MKNLIILFYIILIICSGCSSKNNHDKLNDYDTLMQFIDNNQDYTYNSTHTIINAPAASGAGGSSSEYQIEVINGEIVHGNNGGLTAEDIRKEVKKVLEENKAKPLKYTIGEITCFPLIKDYGHSESLGRGVSSGGWVVCFDHNSHIIYYNKPWMGTWEWKADSIFNISDYEMWVNTVEVEGIYGSKEKMVYCENEECRKFYTLLSKPSESDYTVYLNESINYAYVNGIYLGYIDGIYQVENHQYKSGRMDSDGYFMHYVTEIGHKYSTAPLQPYCDFKQFNKDDLICFDVELNESCEINSGSYFDGCVYCFDVNGYLKSRECYGEKFLKWEKQ